MTTHMASEIAEIPASAARLLADAAAITQVAAAIRDHAPRFAAVCGRGSSGHVETMLRYLIETRMGIIAGHVAPSVVTIYGAQPEMRDGLFIVISQSGQSPDLVATARAARTGGALTLAIVNDAASPLAQACDLVLPVLAGPERAVTATKSVTNSLLACLLLVSEVSGDAGLRAAAGRMVTRFEAALTLDWRGWSDGLADARAVFVVGRGYGLASAREIALKLGEAAGIPAIALSAAELLHGPRAMIGPETPVLILRQQDATATGIDALQAELERQGRRVSIAGGACSTLPWIGDDDPLCDPVAMLVPAYMAIEQLARDLGRDPDAPPNLSKVTRTF